MAKFTGLIFVINMIVSMIQLQGGLLAQDEGISVKQRLKLINKPAVKSFLTEYGDTVDCVEIKKQLAFDHPLLKNHTIQMKPSVKFTVSTSNDTSLEMVLPKTVKCPRGTVPIRRIQEKELNSMEKFKPFSTLATNQLQDVNVNIAAVIAEMKTYGVSGQINVWKPEVKDDMQSSTAFMYVASRVGLNPDGVTAGWTVNRNLYGDDKTRLYSSWSNENLEGCYNVKCPGFVQTSRKVYLGGPYYKISQYGGTQYSTDIGIYQDPNTKDWWLMVRGLAVGYWPKELFVSSFKTQGATRAVWGGEVTSPLSEGNPGMGSGHFPLEGWQKAAYIKKMEVIPETPDQQWTYPKPPPGKLLGAQTQPLCFKVQVGESKDVNWQLHTYFGGPPDCYA